MKSYLALRESMKLEDNNGRFTFTLRASLGDSTGKGDVRLAMESMSEIESINEQFQKLSKCMAFVREEADRRMKSVQLRFGFASLPDEILSLVLSYASQCETTGTIPTSIAATNGTLSNTKVRSCPRCLFRTSADDFDTCSSALPKFGAPFAMT